MQAYPSAKSYKLIPETNKDPFLMQWSETKRKIFKQLWIVSNKPFRSTSKSDKTLYSCLSRVKFSIKWASILLLKKQWFKLSPYQLLNVNMQKIQLPKSSKSYPFLKKIVVLFSYFWQNATPKIKSINNQSKLWPKQLVSLLAQANKFK